MVVKMRIRKGTPLTPRELAELRRTLELEALLVGRPNRPNIINHDDIVDLLIALHKSESVDQFLIKIQ